MTTKQSRTSMSSGEWSHLSKGEVVCCPFEKCEKKFRLRSSFTAHVSRKHRTSTFAQLRIMDTSSEQPSSAFFDVTEDEVDESEFTDSLTKCNANDAVCKAVETSLLNEPDFVSTRVEYKGTLYRKGNLICLKCEEEYSILQFGQIELIFVKDDEMTFLVTPRPSVYLHDYGLYEILAKTKEFICVNAEECLDYYPLNEYSFMRLKILLPLCKTLPMICLLNTLLMYQVHLLLDAQFHHPALQVEDGCDIGGYGPKVRDIGATASKSACISSVSDMGNSANVNPPAKCSRADRTPSHSSERSPTGGAIPSGSSATHSETMCDVDEMSLAASEGDWHPTLTNPSSTPQRSSSGRSRSDVIRANPGIRGPLRLRLRFLCPHRRHPGSGNPGGNLHPSATFSREGTLTGGPQGEQHRARTFTATALIGRAWRPLTHRVFRFSPGVLAADHTLHWTVPGKPDLTPWRGVGSYTHDSCYHSQTDSVCSCPARQWISSTKRDQYCEVETGRKGVHVSDQVKGTGECIEGEFLDQVEKSADPFDGAGTDALPAMTKMEIRGCEKEDPVIGPVMHFKTLNRNPRRGESL
ncbi:hypothetical protein E1301_Tti023112 [Triplophysa tibetana]|uniref:C2H2-type domain-containing protein n=1 Tax=Triplophysa tibetana TaxID=1572043 RepID=A0A5A9PQ86_9TELE|nr:hypothetical protein E1301_Tti023112 [Triplophysa tibetana]